MTLDPYLQKQVELRMDGADILHGALKSLILTSEQNFQAAQNGDPLDADEYDESDSYHNGRLDALTELYALTYDIAFAKGELNGQA